MTRPGTDTSLFICNYLFLSFCDISIYRSISCKLYASCFLLEKIDRVLIIIIIIVVFIYLFLIYSFVVNSTNAVVQ